MKYEFKKLPDSMVEAEVIMDHQEFLAYWQKIYDEAMASVEIKGFRRGAAPKEMADKAIDKEKVFSEATTDAVRFSLQEITKENDWQIVDQPKIEILESEPNKNVGLKFKATLTLFPEVKLGNYEKIAKKVFSDAVKDFSVSEADLKKSIDWILGSRAKLVRLNREAKKGDVVDIDFSGFIGGTPLDGASGKADNFILGEGKFIPGFEENIAGHKEGEKLEFSVDFPKDYWKEDLREKKVDFKAHIHGVFDRQLPELTDDFVKGLGKFENVESFRKSVREGMSKEKEQKEKQKNHLKIIGEVIKDSKIEMPRVMVEKTLDNLFAEYKAYMPKGAAKESDLELRKRLEDRAKNEVATNLVLYQIAKERKLEPSPEEVEAEANHFLSHSQFAKNPKVDPQKVYDYSYGVVQNRKVFEYLENLK